MSRFHKYYNRRYVIMAVELNGGMTTQKKTPPR